MPKRKTGGKSAGKTVSPEPRPAARNGGSAEAQSYTHLEATAALRPDVGVQRQFRKKKPPRTYRYDPRLGPTLQWDEQPAREQGEALIRRIQDAACAPS